MEKCCQSNWTNNSLLITASTTCFGVNRNCYQFIHNHPRLGSSWTSISLFVLPLVDTNVLFNSVFQWILCNQYHLSETLPAVGCLLLFAVSLTWNGTIWLSNLGHLTEHINLCAYMSDTCLEYLASPRISHGSAEVQQELEIIAQILLTRLRSCSSNQSTWQSSSSSLSRMTIGTGPGRSWRYENFCECVTLSKVAYSHWLENMRFPWGDSLVAVAFSFDCCIKTWRTFKLDLLPDFLCGWITGKGGEEIVIE